MDYLWEGGSPERQELGRHWMPVRTFTQCSPGYTMGGLERCFGLEALGSYGFYSSSPSTSDKLHESSKCLGI